MSPLRPPIKNKVESAPTPKSHEESVFEQIKSRLSPEEIKAFEILVRKRLKDKPAMTEFGYPDTPQDSKKLEQKRKEASLGETLESKKHYIQAKIFEALVSELMQLYWFPDAFITETSDFDDWVNGVDAVFEGKSRAALIDFTSHEDQAGIKQKISNIYNKIDSGELGKVKYLKSQTEKGKKMHIENLPAFIISLGHNTIRELINLRLENKKKELAEHWVRYAIAEEVAVQVEKYINYINNPHRLNYDPNKAASMSEAYSDLGRDISEFKTRISRGKATDDLILAKLPQKDLAFKALMDNL